MNIFLRILLLEFLLGGFFLWEIDFIGNKLEFFFFGFLVNLKYLDIIRGLEVEYFSDNVFLGFEFLRILEIIFF